MTSMSLKIWPMFFDAVANGIKTFEIRKGTVGYRVGDTLVLREYDGKDSAGVDIYTGRSVKAKVVYVLHADEFPQGIKENYTILGIEVIR